MEAFPFTPEDWSRVSEAARAVVNATFAEDEVLRACHFKGLRCVLAELCDKYGQHPVLLETEADFTDEPFERIALYEEAKRIAITGGWVTYSIRLSLARILLEELGEASTALQELRACRDEVMACADSSERQEWQELEQACSSPKVEKQTS